MHAESIEQEYKKGRQLIHQIQAQLELLETGRDMSMELQGSVSANINSLTRSAQALEALAQMQAGDRRIYWARNVQQINEECAHLRSSLDLYLHKQHRRAMESRDREALLGRRRTRQEAPPIVLESMRQQGASLQRSSQLIDELTQLGTGVLQSLSEQGDFLKRTHMKVLDLAAMLGVSQSTLRLIERRHFIDKWLVYAGMLLVSILLFSMWYFIMRR